MIEGENDYSFKIFFIPLTTSKAVHWIIFIGIIVYFLSFFNGFVWDDFPQYINNPNTHSLTQIPQILADRNETYYRPFPTIVFAAIYMLVGATAFWYHLLQVLLHIANTILIFFLFKKYLPKALSLFLSLFFLIHPMQVESVAYISSLQTVLSLFFGLVAFFVIESKRFVFQVKYFLVFVLLLLSVLSKETGWLFFVLVPSFMVLKKSNYHRNDYLSFVAVCLLIAVIYSSTFLTKQMSSPSLIAPVPMMHASFLVRLLTLPKIILYYLYTFIFPKDLGVSQQWLVAGLNVSSFIYPLIIDGIFFMSIVAAGIYVRSKNRKLFGQFLFFTVWFVLSFTITWQIIPLDMTVADRWFYFPMIGLLGMIGVLVSLSNKFFDKHRVLIIGLVLVLLTAYSVRTMLRIRDWKDGITLFNHDKTVSYQSYELFNQLGYNYLLEQQYDEAKPYLDTSLQLAPNSWETWGNVGVYYEGKGEIDKAAGVFGKAIQVNPDYYNAYINLTRLYYYYDKFLDEEKFLATKALVKYPKDPYFWSVKAVVDYRNSHKKLGMTEVQKAFDLSHDALYLRLLTLMQQNQNLDTFGK
ncbi:MAG TPA: hypothetical protein VND99_02215 [Candidatus Acidoferrales bacterium]|nr:hypothetical protein [Candidatus Acidoferrales bacterium]